MRLKKKKPKPEYYPEKVPEYRQRKLGETCPHCGGIIILLTGNERRKKSREMGRDVAGSAICSKCKTVFFKVPKKEAKCFGPR